MLVVTRLTSIGRLRSLLTDPRALKYGLFEKQMPYSTQLSPKPTPTAPSGGSGEKRSAAPPQASNKPEPGERTDAAIPDVQRSTKREQMRKNVEGYVIQRYFNYVKNYDKVLEKNFPRAMQMYRAFFDGVRDFFTDMKLYLKVSRIVNESPSGVKALNRWELELYHEMPKSMWKVAPALVGCSLPFVGYAFFPLVFMYPRQFLTHHFWTPAQRVEFQQIYLKQRLLQNKPVLRCLQAKLKAVAQHAEHARLECLLGQLGSGFHPEPDAIIELKDIFAVGALKYDSLSHQHIRRLSELHDIRSTFLKRFRLAEYACLLRQMDVVITREGGAHNLPLAALQQTCYRRGLNPIGLSNDEMLKWLRGWLQVSKLIDDRHTSLLLHLPILLGYNHPNNWQLIYDKQSPKK